MQSREHHFRVSLVRVETYPRDERAKVPALLCHLLAHQREIVQRASRHAQEHRLHQLLSQNTLRCVWHQEHRQPFVVVALAALASVGVRLPDVAGTQRAGVGLLGLHIHIRHNAVDRRADRARAF